MKSSTHLYFLLFVLCALTSCGGGSESGEATNDTSTQIDADNSKTVQTDKTEKAGPFKIKSGIIQYEDKNLKGKIRATFKLTFDNYGSTVKLEEVASGETSIYLFNDLTKKGVTQFPGRTPSKMFMRQGEINRFVALRSTSGFMKQNDEAILGKNCEVQANNAKSAEGESQLTYWMHEGIVMKEINRLGMGYIFEATSFAEQEIDKSTFSLPGGVVLPHDIF